MKNKYKDVQQRIDKNHLDFTIAEIVLNKMQEDEEPAKYINRLAEKYINADGKFFDLEPEHFRRIVDFVFSSICGYQMDTILQEATWKIAGVKCEECGTVVSLAEAQELEYCNECEECYDIN